MATYTISTDTSQQVAQRGNLVSTNIIRQGLISDTSEAYNCFVEQKFSANLQTYMVNYVISISGYYSVYS